MKHLLWLTLLSVLISCNDRAQNEVDGNGVNRERFDSLGREMDSFNKKIQKGVDSTIHEIDSLLIELDKKKEKK